MRKAASWGRRSSWRESYPYTFAAGELAKEYAAGAAEKSSDVDIHYFEDRETMTRELLSYVKEGDTILVKASHFMEFPKVVEALSK